MLALARQADPARAPLWAERESQVHAAARAKAAEVAPPGDPRPLGDIVQARLHAAGIRPGDPALRFIAGWNQARSAAAHQPDPEAEPGPAAEADPGPTASSRPAAGPHRQAGS
jgi:hypothetical protein